MLQVCQECDDLGVPYDCSSIMHYGAETFSTGQWTMRAKVVDGGRVFPVICNLQDDDTCDLRWVGSAFDGRGATARDWELLRRITRPLCRQDKRPRKLRNGKSLAASDHMGEKILN